MDLWCWCCSYACQVSTKLWWVWLVWCDVLAREYRGFMSLDLCPSINNLHIYRNDNNIQLGIYRKPTQSDTTIHFMSNHPLQHKLTAHNFYIHRLLSIPITERAKQQEWNTICTLAKNNGFPLQLIYNLKNSTQPFIIPYKLLIFHIYILQIVCTATT